MTEEFVVTIAKSALLTTFYTALPMLAAGLIAGLLVGILQAVTQVHEMTLTFIPKIVAVGVALMVFLPWIMHTLVFFTRRILNTIPTIAS
jgi:flagellar biosynthetic protein FliQ